MEDDILIIFDHRNLPVLFTTDADFYALMVVFRCLYIHRTLEHDTKGIFLFIFYFSISNGYLGNLVMMLGPQVCFQENKFYFCLKRK